MKKILIIGATSAIAQETARCFASEHASLILIGRNKEKLETLSADLLMRGAESVSSLAFNHELKEELASLGTIDAALIAHGALPDQSECERDPHKAAEAFQVNAVSVIELSGALANIFESQKFGCLAVITSVAGDRGRPSNYVYGAAKGAVNIFLQGLRARLSASGVRVITIKPGFVDTPMTAHLPKNPLYASAKKVGAAIFKTMTSGKKEVVYIPFYWFWIMLIIRGLPEPIFKRLKL